MALDKNKSTRLVNYPDGKIIVEDHNGDSASATLAVDGRNQRSHIYVPTSVAKTINLNTTFVSDPDDKQYDIKRKAGDTLVFIVEDESGAGTVITWGTGFAASTPVTTIPTDNNGVVVFEYVEAVGNISAGFMKVSEIFTPQ